MPTNQDSVGGVKQPLLTARKSGLMVMQMSPRRTRISEHGELYQ